MPFVQQLEGRFLRRLVVPAGLGNPRVLRWTQEACDRAFLRAKLTTELSETRFLAILVVILYLSCFLVKKEASTPEDVYLSPLHTLFGLAAKKLHHNTSLEGVRKCTIGRTKRQTSCRKPERRERGKLSAFR